MKKLFLVAWVAMLTQWMMFAGPVTPEQAQKIAESYLNKNQLRSGSKPLALTYTHRAPSLKSSDADFMMQPAYYYVFNRGTHEGFAIVSADDRTAPVLGYSETGHFDLSKAPAHVRAWMAQYDAEYQYLYSHPELSIKTKSLRAEAPVRYGEGDIQPLLKEIRWDQGHPYNSMCPIDAGGRSYSGCVATAMAQIMRMHKWPKKAVEGKFSYQDAGAYVVRSITFGEKEYEWDKMPENFDDHRNPTTEEADAIGYLLKEVGHAVKMSYSSTGSGAYECDALEAFKSRFHFKKKARLQFRAGHTAESWANLILTELKAGRPLFYCGAGDGGAHAYVCDGYKKDTEMFHFNWGWGGMANGFYRLNALEPSELGIGAGLGAYNKGQSIIVDLIPHNDNGSDEEVRPTAPYLLTRAGSLSSGTRLNAEVTVSQFAYNTISVNIFASTYAKGNDRAVTPIDTKQTFYSLGMQRPYPFRFDFDINTSKYPDGDYEVRYTWSTDKFQSQEPFSPTNDEPQIVYFSVKNGKIVENSISYDNTLEPLRAKMVEGQTLYAFAPSKVKLQVTNPNKKEYYGPMEFYLSDRKFTYEWRPRTESISSSCITVPAGKTIDVELEFTIDELEQTQLYPYVRFANLSKTMLPEYVGYFFERARQSAAQLLVENPITVQRPTSYKEVTLVATHRNNGTFTYDIDPSTQSVPSFQICNRGQKALPGSESNVVISALLLANVNGKPQAVAIASNSYGQGIPAGQTVEFTPRFSNAGVVKKLNGYTGYVLLKSIIVDKNGNPLQYAAQYPIFYQNIYETKFHSPRPNEEVSVETDELIVAPNPANEEASLQSVLGLNYISVFAMDGSMVFSRDLNGETHYRFDTSALPTGRYVVAATCGDQKVLTAILVVQH